MQKQQKKTKIFKKNKSGSTPLALAKGRGRKAMVDTLIACGADVNAHGSFGRSPLFTALERAHEFIARLLIAKGADLYSEVAENGQELLLRIMDYEPGKTGPENLIKLLVIEKKVNVSFTDRYGLTPLGGAAISGYESIVKILIEEGGASLGPRDGIGRAPLALALEAGHEPMVELLIEKGAELNTEDDKHLTPLPWARALSTRTVGQMPRHDWEEIVKLMIDPKVEDVLDPW